MKNYSVYPEYKSSGIDWLCDIPEHWEIKRLRFMLQMNPSKQEIDLPSEQEVSFLPMEAVGEDGSLSLEQTRPISEVSSGYTYFAENDVTFAKITPCFENGKGAIMRGLTGNCGFGTTELTVLRCLPGLDNEFLFYLVKSDLFRKNGEAWMYGAGGQKRVPDEFVKEFRFSFPPLPEQQAIAAFLDRETAKIDGVIGKREKLIELLQEKRSALISHAVTKGLDPEVKLKPSGIDWLGDIPEHWEVKKLAYVTMMKSGESITSEQFNDDGKYPVFGGNGLRGYYDQFTHDGFYILIGRQGALCGNINYGHGRFWASEHAIVVTPIVPLSSLWLGELLRNMNLNQYSITAAQPGLSVDLILSKHIPYPPQSEQQAIAEYLDKETAKIDSLIEKEQAIIGKLKEYRLALISEAVTGKIDIRHKKS